MDDKVREEEVKNRLRQDYFGDYDATPILGDVDFAVTLPMKEGTELFDREYFLWAEAKKGTKEDIYASFVQLIITIGKAKTHEKYLPPHFLGAFDHEKIAFIEFHHVVDVFYMNDFNWNVTPSNHNTEEFHMLYDLLHDKLAAEITVFKLAKDEKMLRQFIHKNFRMGSKSARLNITKNNYLFVFQRWVEEVMPSIAVDWSDIPRNRVVDFFFADLISRNDYTRGDNLAVLLRGSEYKILEEIRKSGKMLFSEAGFRDKKEAYNRFWNKYERPPRKEFLDIILKRRDLLIPQNLRRYQGAFFTPPQWVQKSQEYLEAELGENWQQEYYVWDCCAGTGNLLYGLTEPHRVWATTLDDADVQVMKERIKEGSLNLYEEHVAQFDFLNDDFSKLPDELQAVINDEEKRKRLVVYINPPYAEAGEGKQRSGTAKNKTGVSNTTKIHKDYAVQCGKYAKRELFVQFLMRIYKEISNCIIAEFSKTKILQSPYFEDFRNVFQPLLKKGFLIPADTFDNVKGNFPIGFFVWDCKERQRFSDFLFDVYTSQDSEKGFKTIVCYDTSNMLNDWLRPTWKYRGEYHLGYLACNGNDFQNQNYINIDSIKRNQTSTYLKPVNEYNLMESCIYLSVRRCVNATWLNDRDQYLYPNDGWQADMEFQSDCLAYTLFTNNIQSRYGVNHWIPFTEKEVGAHQEMESHFMVEYINGKHRPKPQQQGEGDLFGNTMQSAEDGQTKPIVFSPEAQAVMDAGRELWRYYHQQPGANANASYYDIRLHFQGTKLTKSGKEQMNSESQDKRYNQLVGTLRERVKALAKKIEPKVYEYGFLKK